MNEEIQKSTEESVMILKDLGGLGNSVTCGLYSKSIGRFVC